MNKRNVWIFFCFFCFLTSSSQVVSPYAKNYSLRNGLADWVITGLTQDSAGFLWVGTAEGLHRFDGYDFQTFNRFKSAPYYIPYNHIDEVVIFQDSLIAITYGDSHQSLDFINYRTLELYPNPLEENTIVKGRLKKINLDVYENKIYLLTTTDTHLYLYQYQHPYKFTEVLEVKIPTSKPEPRIQFARADAQHWIISHSSWGCGLWNEQEGLIEKYEASDFVDQQLLPVNTMDISKVLYRDRNGRVWISFAQRGELYLLNANQKSWQGFSSLSTPIPNYEYSFLWEDKEGNLLVGATNGRGSYPPFQKAFLISPKLTTENFSSLQSLTRFPSALFSQNFQETVFLGTPGALKIFRNNPYSIKNYLARDLPDDAFGISMRGMTQDPTGTIYFGAENTYWYALDSRTHRIDTLTVINQETNQRVNFDCCFSLNYQGGYLWGIACQGDQKGLLIQYDIVTSRSRIFPYDARFRHMTIDQNGLIWILTAQEDGEGELLSFDPATEQYTAFNSAEGQNPFFDIPLNFIFSDPRGKRLWVGSDRGLFALELTKRVIKKIDGPKNLLQNRSIKVISRDKKGTLWVGTTTGMIGYNPDDPNAPVKFFDQSNGLANHWVCGIQPDNHGNIWVSTQDGLSCIEDSLDQVLNFYRVDGLANDQFNRYSFYYDEKEDYLYFGTINGVSAFQPLSLLRKQIIVAPRIAKLSWLDKRRQTRQEEIRPDYLTSIYLPWYARYINLHLMIPEFANPVRNKFRVKLAPFDRDWNYLGTENLVRFNQIPGGEYTLYIQGADAQGNWGEIAAIPLCIDKFITETWWFWLVVLLIIGYSAYRLVRYRWEQKLRVERLRTKISSDIHDEVSGLLAGIAMQSEVLEATAGNITMQKKLQHISEVSRKAMSKLSDVIWSVDSRKDRVSDLIDRMRNDLEELLTPLSINYSLDVGRLDLQAIMPVQTRQDIYFIFKEAVNNAIKHGNNVSAVEIRLGNTHGGFELSIEDNGIVPASPITDTSSFSGQGISNMRMRAQRLGGTLRIITKEGFRIQLFMPKFS